MKVYEIIPIARSLRQASALSYFSTKELNPGDLVSVHVRQVAVPAVVKKVSDVRFLKSEIKIQSFKLKPVKSFLKKKFLSVQTLAAVERLHRETLLPEGFILFILLPKAIISPKVVSPGTPSGRYWRESALKGSFEERALEYRALIREHFARGKSMVIASPLAANLARLEAELKRGIEPYVFSLSGLISPKKYLERWNQAANLEHPILVLGTAQVLNFEREDLETLILDEEGSDLWHLEEWTRLDLRKAAAAIAEMKKLKLIRSDQVLQITTLWGAEAGALEEKTPPLARIGARTESVLVNLAESGEKLPFSWFSPELVSALEQSRAGGEKILIFVNRKGFSPFTVCADCSRSILCPSCSAPLVLHLSPEGKKEFLCHHCLKSSEVPERCPSCLSWRLKDYGLGLEKIELELKKLFPKTELLRLERETSRTRSLAPEFFKSQIVVASEFVLSYPEAKFDFTGIISLDHLLTIPDFRMGERIFRLVTALKEKTLKKIILQTRLASSPLFSQALGGNLSQFYQAEIKERETLGYPPFSRLIKLARQDANWPRLKAEAARAASVLKSFSPISSPAFLEKTNDKYRWNIILKVLPETWPGNQELARKLETLQSSWEIVVDPKSLI